MSSTEARYKVSRDYRGAVHLQIEGEGGSRAALVDRLRADLQLAVDPADHRPILVLQIDSSGQSDFAAGVLCDRFTVIVRETPTSSRACCTVLYSRRPDFAEGKLVDDLATCLKREGQGEGVVAGLLTAAQERWNATWKG